MEEAEGCTVDVDDEGAGEADDHDQGDDDHRLIREASLASTGRTELAVLAGRLGPVELDGRGAPWRMLSCVVSGAFADLCVADVAVSVAFYRRLLGLEVRTDLGWYVELADGDGDRTVLALVQSGHATVPKASVGPPRGLLVSFEVDDAEAIERLAREIGCPFVRELTTELGQCHFMVLDPDGAVVDVIERVPMTAEDRRRLFRGRRALAPTRPQP